MKKDREYKFLKYRPLVVALILILETIILVALDLGYFFAKLELMNNFENLEARELLRAHNNAEIFRYVSVAVIVVITTVNSKLTKKWWLSVPFWFIPVAISFSVMGITYAVAGSAGVI